MKITKQTKATHLRVDDTMHSHEELEDLRKEGVLKKLFYSYRLSTTKCKSIKVLLRNGEPHNIAILNNNRRIFVVLDSDM